jgi:hypothetical protein
MRPITPALFSVIAAACPLASDVGSAHAAPSVSFTTGFVCNLGLSANKNLGDHLGLTFNLSSTPDCSSIIQPNFFACTTGAKACPGATLYSEAQLMTAWQVLTMSQNASAVVDVASVPESGANMVIGFSR